MGRSKRFPTPVPVAGAARAAALALAVALLLGAVAAPFAQAVEFEATNPPGTVSGYDEGSGEIVTEAGSIVCDETSFSGSYEEEFFGTLRLHAEFEECSAFGFINATVDTGFCDFLYTPTTYFALFADAEVGIDCWSETTEAIEVTAATCSVEIPGVEGLTEMTIYHGGGSILLFPEVDGLPYTVTNDGFLCPFSGVGEREDGEWVSEEPVQITASLATIDIVE